MVFRKFDNDEAISPIIGTILMVAITVIMAAIIANWSAGIKAPESPKSVGLDVSRSSEKNVTITITSIDPPQTVVNTLIVTFNNGSGTVRRVILGIGAPNSSGFVSNNNSYTDVKTNYVFSLTDTMNVPTQANVGDSATLYVSSYNEFIVIIANYADGTTKTIYSQKV